MGKIESLLYFMDSIVPSNASNVNVALCTSESKYGSFNFSDCALVSLSDLIDRRDSSMLESESEELDDCCNDKMSFEWVVV